MNTIEAAVADADWIEETSLRAVEQLERIADSSCGCNGIEDHA